MKCKNCEKVIKLRGVDYIDLAGKDGRLEMKIMASLCPSPDQDWVHEDGTVTCDPHLPVVDAKEWFAAHSAAPSVQ